MTGKHIHPLPGDLEALLRGVSRSFYLTLRILPAPIRPQIALAYLLARAADTIADTALVGADRRADALTRFSRAVRTAATGEVPAAVNLGELAAARARIAGKGAPAERLLLRSISRVLALLRATPSDDRSRIADVLDIIVSGQQQDLARFASRSGIVALETDEELDDYTYRVAGCVGEFWTRMCRAHLFPNARIDDAPLVVEGMRFGKGLQHVNILRDLAGDLREGRCYIPRQRLGAIGLEPADLLESSSMERFRPLYLEYLDLTIGHLAAGWHYTTVLPFGQLRTRLACAWPLLIGVRTVDRLRETNVLDPGRIVRIPRTELRNLVVRTLVRYPFPAAWNRLFSLVRS